MRRRLAAIGCATLLAAATTAPAAAAATAASQGWHGPSCSTVGSDGKVTFTRNRGVSLVPTVGQMNSTQYLNGLATLATPNHLLGVDDKGRLYLSRDAGCEWLMFGTLDGYVPWPQITAAPDGSAYVWSRGDQLFRVTGTEVSALPRVPLDDYATLVGVSVDPGDAEHLRAIGEKGSVLESTDGGHSFTAIGRIAEEARYDASVDPTDFDHIVVGTYDVGVVTSFDGGRSWRKAEGLGAAADRVNVFSTAISPGDPSVVYAQGINLAEHNAGEPHEGRHIYRSTDGGRTFTRIIDQVLWDIVLPNGTLLAPDPHDPAILYFVFGMSSRNFGTNLYRYDARTHHVTWTHNDHDGIKVIAFNPAQPNIMYLGLEEERYW